MTSDTTTPRYFARATSSPETAEWPRGDPSRAVHVLDLFRAGAAGEAEREWVVCADLDGSLDLVAIEDREGLPPEAQAALSHHEIRTGARLRRIDASQLHLFAVQLVEQPADSAGLNDLCYLYGRLTGPFPPARGGALAACDGQLATTRADILDGFVQGAPHAFHHPSAPAAASPGRSFHLMLPGGRAEEVETGRSIVLAYPVLPPEIASLDPTNERLAVQILHDLLRALEEEIERTGGPALPRRVPVPSRAALVAQLQADGWTVKGDRAVRHPASRNVIGAVVRNLLYSETMTLPPEGGMDDFIAMARMALESIPGWPDQRSRALHARVGAGVAGVRPAAIPAPPPAPPVAPAQRLPPRLQRPRSDDWMQDFIESHASSGTSRKPRLTSAATLAPPQAKVDWRGDFETRDSPAPTPKKRREADPDWMKDFQGPDGKGPSSRGR